MALVAGNTVTTAGTGGSDHIHLDAGEWIATVVWAGSAGDADLQCSPDATNWFDVEDSNGVVNFTADGARRIPGSLRYRMDVTTHTSAATLTAFKYREQ